MKKRFLTLTTIILVLSLCFALLVACKDTDKDESKEDTSSSDEVRAYCAEEYNASYGNFGYFKVSAIDDNELVEKHSDLSTFTLGGAFKGMEVVSIEFDINDYSLYFGVKGALQSGDFGTISGEGIIKDYNVSVDIPITYADAYTNDVLYENMNKQDIEINLTNACFNEDITADDFVLRGAASGAKITAVAVESDNREGDVKYLSQSAVLTIEGSISGEPYAYIDIKESATTYNKDIDLSIKAEFNGIDVSKSIDTHLLRDIVYVEAINVTFSDIVEAKDITFDGALKDYAKIVNIDRVSDKMVALEIAFPYNYIATFDSIGYIIFGANTNVEGVECRSAAIIETPSIEYEMIMTGSSVSIEVVLANEIANDITPADIAGVDIMGNDVVLSNVTCSVSGNVYTVSFDLPEDAPENVNIVISGAYTIVNSDGANEDVDMTIKL